MAAEAQGKGAIGVNQPPQFANTVVEHQSPAHALHAATGGTGAGAEETGEHQQKGHETRPGGGVGAGVAGTGAERGHLERGVTQGFIGALEHVEGQQTQGHQQNVEEHHADVEPELWITHESQW